MAGVQLGVVESRFADIIWENEPISSSEIVKIALAELKWKKSTTYTVLKRLCDKGIFENNKGIVTSLITKEQFNSIQCEHFIEENFEGSLPAFLAAFTSRKQLTHEEMEYLKNLIAEHKEE